MPFKKRSLKNFLLVPRLQLPVAIYSTISAFCFVSLCGFVFYNNSHEALSLIIDMTDIGEETKQILWQTISDSMLYLILFSILFIVSNIVIAAVVSHKMVGPIVQFLRHTQCLRNKDFSSRIQLRKNDGFSELANELNELANDLENKSR